jgi:hypothetical protein
MLNVPLQLRIPKGFNTPKGPSFVFATTLDFSVFGTRVTLRAPRHRSRYKSESAAQPWSNYNDENVRLESFDKDLALNDSWKYVRVAYRAWTFYGPWFSGPLADLSMSIRLLTPTRPKPGVSLFHPRAFEGAVGDYLTQQYGGYKRHGRSEWITPVEWTPLTRYPCLATSVWALANEEVSNRPRERYLFFAIVERYLLAIRFRLPRRGNDTLAELDKLIDPRPQEELMARILETLNITLSPQAQAQQAQALAGLDQPQLIATFPPMKWTDANDDTEWEKYKRLHRR